MRIAPDSNTLETDAESSLSLSRQGQTVASSPPRAHPVDSPLSLQDHQALNAATRRVAGLSRAAKIAHFNGITSGVFAAGCAMFFFTGVSTVLTGLGLVIISWNELRGRKRLLSFDPKAPRLLAWNQLGLMSLLIVYSLWHLYVGLTGPNPYEQHIANTPELETVLGPITELYRIFTVAVYGSVIVLSIIFQGLNAWYYIRQEKILTDYLNQTPPWIVELHRSLRG